MSEELHGIFPRQFILPEKAPFEIVWIYVNWLNQELDAMAEERWPILKTISGFRRKEVIAAIQNHDWTAGVLNTKMWTDG